MVQNPDTLKSYPPAFSLPLGASLVAMPRKLSPSGAGVVLQKRIATAPDPDPLPIVDRLRPTNQHGTPEALRLYLPVVLVPDTRPSAAPGSTRHMVLLRNGSLCAPEKLEPGYRYNGLREHALDVVLGRHDGAGEVLVPGTVAVVEPHKSMRGKPVPVYALDGTGKRQRIGMAPNPRLAEKYNQYFHTDTPESRTRARAQFGYITKEPKSAGIQRLREE